MTRPNDRYAPADIEPRWQLQWEQDQTFAAAEDPARPKFYVLCMFPYPSGSGLHVGHPLSYTAVDIVARQKRMTGHAVLNPIGFDSFGLPAERAAEKEKRHPAEITAERIDYFRTQMKRLGLSFNWEREVSTHTPEYYRWTQWIFLKLYEQGLAYLSEVPVWWCPAQGTVLANEEVVDGRYVETGDLVERRMMKQWMLRITAYAERLVADLDEVDWPEGVKEMQRQWVGRSEGAEVRFEVQGHGSFVVYTTRPDTLFGATWCVLAPEHPLVAQITTDAQRAEVDAYVQAAVNRSDMDRQLAAEKQKTGVFTGAYAVNPVTGEPVPVWVADYVLGSYGTGAIMAVPAHDERDHAFARAFGLPVKEVIQAPAGHDYGAAAWTGDGVLVNSGLLDGLRVAEAKSRIIDWLEQRGAGVRKINYKLRDWLFSRQRYWGEPFPVVHSDDGEVIPLGADALPVTLPFIDEYKPTADGRPPLARAADDWLFVDVNGRRCQRETNTMPQWAGSCWYYLRYMDPHNTAAPWSEEAVAYWKEVDLYIGGVEHAVLHLLYARFWHKVLYDCGLVPTREPFRKLFNQGMIVAHAYREQGGRYHAPDTVEQRAQKATLTSAFSGERVETDWWVKGTDTPVEQKLGKMGKSLNNSVDPMDIIAQYGADTLRVYEMFMGPLEASKPWQTSGCDGVFRFLARVWRLFVDEDSGELRPFAEATPREVRKALHTAIRETTDGIEQLKFNTPVSKMMELVNACGGQLPTRADAEDLLRILSPYAPHLAEELWCRLGHSRSIGLEAWPAWDPTALVDDTVTLSVQVQGKLRGTIEVPAGIVQDVDAVVQFASSHPNVLRHLGGATPKRTIYIKGKIVNFVV